MYPYNLQNIIDFLADELHDEYNEFSQYYCRVAEHDLHNDVRTRRNTFWAGRDPLAQAQSLVDEMQGLRHFYELPYYLCSYWLDTKQGGASALTQYNIDLDLCLSAQQMWNFPVDPGIDRQRQHALTDEEALRQQLAPQVFALLARVNQSFAEEWYETPWAQPSSPLSLPLPLLDGPRSLDDLITHLRNCRMLYQRATHSRQDHDWIAARRDYLELENKQPGYGDTSLWANGLQDLRAVETLQKMVDAALSEYLYDDRLPWDGDYPYRFLEAQASEVTPYTPTNQIAEVVTRLGANQPDISHDQLANLEMLTHDDQRVFVDAFLYPIKLTSDHVLLLEQAFCDHDFTLPDATWYQEAGFPEATAAAFLILSDQPDITAASWTKRQQSDPQQGWLAHCQALLNLGMAYSFDLRSDTEQCITYWKRAISQWTMTLVDTAYWIRWGKERYQFYSKSSKGTTTPVRGLRIRIRNFLAQKLREKQDQLAAAGDSVGAERFAELHLDLFIEFCATDLLYGVGGVPISISAGDQAGEELFSWFGPLWMEQFKWQDHVARFLSQFRPDPMLLAQLPDNPSAEWVHSQLCWYFSQLKYAAVQLLDSTVHNPLRTLAVLEKLHTAPSIQSPDFNRQNPAYKLLAAPHTQWDKGFLQIKIEAHFHCAAEQVDGVTVKNRPALQQAWSSALEETEIYTRDEIAARIHSFIAARIRQLDQDSSLEQFTSAIQLIQTGRLVLGAEAAEDRLTKVLAEIYYRRGKRKDMAVAPDLFGAEEDYSIALDLLPQWDEVRYALGLARFHLAIELSFEDRFLALSYLHKSTDVLSSSNHPQLATLLEEISVWEANLRTGQIPQARSLASAAVDPVPLSPNEISEEARLFGLAQGYLQDNHPGEALKTLEQMWTIISTFKNNPMFERLVVRALIQQARALSEENQQQEAEKLFTDWLPRLKSQRDVLAGYLEFLRHWPQMRDALEGASLQYQMTNTQSIAAWYGDSMPLLPVFLDMTNDYLRAHSEIMPFRGDLDTVVHDLLSISSQITLFKVCKTEGSRFELEGCIPFRMISSAWLQRIALMLNDYTNVPIDSMSRDRLVSWYAEKRAEYNQPDTTLAVNDIRASMSFLENWCRANPNIRYQRVATSHYRVTVSDQPPVEVRAWLDGIQLILDLSPLTIPPTQLAQLNAGLGLGKLSLLENDMVRLSIEVPYLDRQMVGMAFEHIVELAKQISAQLHR